MNLNWGKKIALKKTIDICQAMKESGANYSLLFTPHYYKKHMTYNALLDYFTKVADKSPIPIILHNVPSTTFIDLPVELCCDLSEHPNIVAIKECSHNVILFLLLVLYFYIICNFKFNSHCISIDC